MLTSWELVEGENGSHSCRHTGMVFKAAGVEKSLLLVAVMASSSTGSMNIF